MKITKSQLRQIIKEEISSMSFPTGALHGNIYALFEPFSSTPYGRYDSLEKLVAAIDQLKQHAPDWEDFSVITPDGNTVQAYQLTDFKGDDND